MNETHPDLVRPPAPAQLLCDEMLGGLARWLRAAGYDAQLAMAGQKDDELVACSRREGRTIVTLDRGLAERDGAPRILRLDSPDLDRQAMQLKATLGIDWLRSPFTRCMIDNAPLVELEDGRLDRLPLAARRLPGPFRECPTCGRTYWRGSHAKRILRRLEGWALEP
jgi:uncharacterized protein with PIN domain